MNRLPVGPSHAPLKNHLWIGRDGEGRPFISRRDCMDTNRGVVYMSSNKQDVIWLEEEWFPEVPNKTIIKISIDKFKHLGLQDLAHLNFLTIGDKTDAHSETG